MPWRDTQPTSAPANTPRFGGWARLYDLYRPRYPAALFSILEQACETRGLCIELGAGTGQATAPLCALFERVLAVEPDAEMAAMIPTAPGLGLIQASAERALITSGMADAVVAATSLHWMDVPLVLKGAGNWLRPDGVFFACTFATSQYPGAPPAALSVMRRYGRLWRGHLHERLSSWRTAEEHLTASPHFRDVRSFEIYVDFQWTARAVAGFLMTTSFAQASAKGEAADMFEDLATALESATAGRPMLVRFPIEGSWARRV